MTTTIPYRLKVSNIYYVTFIICLSLGISLKSHAFELSPIIASLEPQGIKAEQVYLLTNSSNTPAAIEFSITTRQQRRDGSEIREPAADLFNLYPSQVVIPSGGTQKVRLKWLGKKAVTGEQAYRFIAKQLPIKLSDEKGISLKMAMAMEGIVYVKPPRPELPPYKTTKQLHRPLELLKITEVKMTDTPEGKQLMLTVTNSAKEHIYLNNIQIQLTANGQNIVLQGTQLGGMQQHNILAGTVRDFIMPLPEQFNRQKNWAANIRKALLVKTE